MRHCSQALADRFNELSSLYQTITLFLWLYGGQLESLLSRRPLFHKWLNLQIMVWTRQVGKHLEFDQTTNAESILRNFVFSALEEHFDVPVLQGSLSIDSKLVESMRKYFKERKFSEPAELIHTKVIKTIGQVLKKFGVLKYNVEECIRRNNCLVFCDVLVDDVQSHQLSQILDYDLKRQFDQIRSQFISDFDDSDFSEFFTESKPSQLHLGETQSGNASLGFVMRDDIGNDPRTKSYAMHTQNVQLLRRVGVVPIELNLNVFLEIYSMFDPRNFENQSNPNT